ncbi:MAG: sugar phosphate isomerase/epimerase family protein [Desulfonatronovibrio sp.]
MTSFFVNLPLKFIYQNPDIFELFLKNRLCPELGIDSEILDFDDYGWHARRKNALTRQGLTASVHMPFLDLKPGSPDHRIRRASAESLEKAALLARHYQPGHIIVHSGYRPGAYDEHYTKWLENSVATWSHFLDLVPDIPVYMENVYEHEPSQILDLLRELGGKVGFCFDVGHWFSFGCGESRQDLSWWLQSMEPFLNHLHLHDNAGNKDEHLGLGGGAIPFAALFEGLEHLELSPTFTLEPHSRDDLVQSLEYMLSHKYWFSLLGLNKSDFAHLQETVSSI